MSDLPAGWRMSNNTGNHIGREPEEEDDYSDDGVDSHGSGSETGRVNGLDIRPDSPGWEDAEDEENEELNVKCFLCDSISPSGEEMVEHCKSTHDLDFLAVIKQQSLDFYATIKLVNYIRIQAQAGETKLDLSDSSKWADDKFMQPAMEDDALLFSLDEIVDFDQAESIAPIDYDEMRQKAEASEQKTDLGAIAE